MLSHRSIKAMGMEHKEKRKLDLQTNRHNWKQTYYIYNAEGKNHLNVVEIAVKDDSRRSCKSRLSSMLSPSKWDVVHSKIFEIKLKPDSAGMRIVACLAPLVPRGRNLPLPCLWLLKTMGRPGLLHESSTPWEDQSTCCFKRLTDLASDSSSPEGDQDYLLFKCWVAQASTLRFPTEEARSIWMWKGRDTGNPYNIHSAWNAICPTLNTLLGVTQRRQKQNHLPGQILMLY